jgi:hypothetical protein
MHLSEVIRLRDIRKERMAQVEMCQKQLYKKQMMNETIFGRK